MRGTTLVIPAWNEPDAIGRLLHEVAPQAVDRVIVVVGSATDPTGAVAAARGAEVLVQRRAGYGAACHTGAAAALDGGASVIAFLDGDYADPPDALPRILEPLRADRADLVLGCRDLTVHPHALPYHARLGNAAARALVHLLYGQQFRDLPSLKAIRADAFSTLDMREMTYGWTVEMLVKSVRAGLRIEEVPIAYRPRLGGRSKVAGSVRGSLGAASCLIGCALRYAAWQPGRVETRAFVRGS
ncbi:MAG: glycosyltransferase [Chloroflexi bacterium]|nr:glycosyltransferase [Chloroflexota bacterium]